MSDHAKTEVAVFGGGCFWCTEAVFNMLKGVESVVSGYAGGEEYRTELSNNSVGKLTEKVPTYEGVSAGTTGYAEVIKIVFDPAQISFTDLLTVFFASHDPTTLNRQGNDIGMQYRSIILYSSEEQKSQAEAFIAELNASSKQGKDIVTEIAPLINFFPAESYHQNFYENNPNQAYCQIVINPKLEKVQKQFSLLVKNKSKEN